MTSKSERHGGKLDDGLKSIFEVVKLLSDDKEWSTLEQRDWDTLQTFLKEQQIPATDGTNKAQIAGLAMISVQMKVAPLRKAVKDKNDDEREKILER